MVPRINNTSSNMLALRRDLLGASGFPNTNGELLVGPIVW